MHAPIHIVNAPEIDKNGDSEVFEFINEYITCASPDEAKYPEMRNLVKKVQTHHHTFACRQKKGVICRFNAPLTASDKTSIVCSEEKTILLQEEQMKP